MYIKHKNGYDINCGEIIYSYCFAFIRSIYNMNVISEVLSCIAEARCYFGANFGCIPGLAGSTKIGDIAYSMCMQILMH